MLISGVEVGREPLAVLARVAVDDVERVDGVEFVLVQPGGEYVGHAGVEAAAEQCHAPLRAEAILVGPLPLVFELRLVGRFVVGGVDVVHAGRKAGVHDRQILVGQRDVDDEFRLFAFEQRGHLRHVIGIDLGGGNRALDLRGDAPAFLLGAAGEHDVLEHLRQLRALVGHDLAHAAGADDQHLRHRCSLPRFSVRSRCNRAGSRRRIPSRSGVARA